MLAIGVSTTRVCLLATMEARFGERKSRRRAKNATIPDPTCGLPCPAFSAVPGLFRGVLLDF